MASRFSISSSAFDINIGGPAEAIGLEEQEVIIDPREDVRVRIKGRGTAKGSTQADAWGIRGGTFIFGAQRDRLTGEAMAEGFSPGIEVNAIGIEAAHIHMGDGNDRLIGKATAKGLNPTDDVKAIGLKDVEIDLGAGNDRVTAIAKGNGIKLGVYNTTINGGGGDDVFDIQSGQGTIKGGNDLDTLMLEGNFEDYNFAEISNLELGVNITKVNSSTLYSTDLDVSEVERFRFSGQSGFLEYDELF